MAFGMPLTHTKSMIEDKDKLSHNVSEKHISSISNQDIIFNKSRLN